MLGKTLARPTIALLVMIIVAASAEARPAPNVRGGAVWGLDRAAMSRHWRWGARFDMRRYYARRISQYQGECRCDRPGLRRWSRGGVRYDASLRAHFGRRAAGPFASLGQPPVWRRHAMRWQERPFVGRMGRGAGPHHHSYRHRRGPV